MSCGASSARSTAYTALQFKSRRTAVQPPGEAPRSTTTEFAEGQRRMQLKASSNFRKAELGISVVVGDVIGLWLWGFTTSTSARPAGRYQFGHSIRLVNRGWQGVKLATDTVGFTSRTCSSHFEVCLVSSSVLVKSLGCGEGFRAAGKLFLSVADKSRAILSALRCMIGLPCPLNIPGTNACTLRDPFGRERNSVRIQSCSSVVADSLPSSPSRA